MAQDLSAWDVDVDGRIKIIADELAQADFAKEVPGLQNLLDDYLDPNVEVDKVDFHRRLLRTFKQSQTDNTYQDLLAKYTQDEQDRLERFVDGDDPAKVSHGFIMGPSLGAREEVDLLKKAKGVQVSADGPVHVDGLSSDQDQKHESHFHEFIHGLAEMFHFHKDKDIVTVSLGLPFDTTITNHPRFTTAPSSKIGVLTSPMFLNTHAFLARWLA